jgi:prepilin-type N-terminal cleavage/methylation domain-containing protein
MASVPVHSTARENEQGFTLIELLLVLTVLGILAAVGVPGYLAIRTRAYDASAKSELAQARIAAHAHLVAEETFSGLTVAQLRAYDGALPDRLVVGTTTKDTYCLETTVGSRTWSISGPQSDVLAQTPCVVVASGGLVAPATDPSRSEPTKEELAKADEARAEEAKAEEAKAEEAKIEQAKADESKAELAKAEDAKAEQAKTGDAKTDDARAEQARAEEAKAAQAKAEAGK